MATAHLSETNLGLIVIVKNSTFYKCGWRALFCFSRVIRGTLGLLREVEGELKASFMCAVCKFAPAFEVVQICIRVQIVHMNANCKISIHFD